MRKSNLRVMTIVGTRPEIIRLSSVIRLLDRTLDHVLVHTGQNWDYELNEIFFEDLGLRKPDHFMGVNVSSLGHVLGEILIKSEELMRQEKPDAVLILGDTNSAVSAIMAKRLRIPVYHMEAGNRCFDLNVPEEINRRLVDHIADFNLVYTEHARRHLLSEGLPHRRIYLTGSPMYEVLQENMKKIDDSDALAQLELEKNRYFMISVHREENVDHPDNLRKILFVLDSLAKEYDVPVVVSLHPRTRKRIEALENAVIDPRIRFMKPFGFSDYVALQKNALCTVSDSGTISEESSMLSFPAVTIREAMERPEALDEGTMIMTGFDAEVVLDAVRLAVQEQREKPYDRIPDEYTITNTSWRVVKLILGTAKLSNQWDGIRPKPL